MKVSETITGIGIMTMILGAAGIAGAIEMETGLILALGVTVVGIVMIIAGLGLESNKYDQNYNGKHFTNFTVDTWNHKY